MKLESRNLSHSNGGLPNPIGRQDHITRVCRKTLRQVQGDKLFSVITTFWQINMKSLNTCLVYVAAKKGGFIFRLNETK